MFVNRTKSKTALIETALTGESLYSPRKQKYMKIFEKFKKFKKKKKFRFWKKKVSAPIPIPIPIVSADTFG